MNDANETKPDPLLLSPEELKSLSAHGKTRVFGAKTVVVTEGDLGVALYVILEGRCKAYVSDADGREAVLSIMGPAEYFGEITLDDGPRSASVVTLEPVKLLIVPQAEFRALLAANPDFALHFIDRLIRRVRSLTRAVGNLALLDVYGRVARLLLDSARDEAGRQVVDRLRQTDIAGRVGCSREMVSRIFKDLVKGGYIALEEDRIVILRKPPSKW